MTVFTGLAIVLGIIAIAMNLYVRIGGYRRQKRIDKAMSEPPLSSSKGG